MTNNIFLKKEKKQDAILLLYIKILSMLKKLVNANIYTLNVKLTREHNYTPYVKPVCDYLSSDVLHSFTTASALV